MKLTIAFREGTDLSAVSEQTGCPAGDKRPLLKSCDNPAYGFDKRPQTKSSPVRRVAAGINYLTITRNLIIVVALFMAWADSGPCITRPGWIPALALTAYPA